jgi:isopentenyl diphosphate isomerase/L-lactate dehydrogenase-like FMN-dependent dehydrogenase
LAASPLLAAPGLLGGPTGRFASKKHAFEWMLAAAEKSTQKGGLITSADQALDVMHFEPVTRRKLPPAHFAYIQTVMDDDATVRANHEAFSHFQIRPLVNVDKLDSSVRLFGTIWKTPIFLCPVSFTKAFHEEGEVAVATGARTKDHLMILSAAATSSSEEVTAARGAPVWQQPYTTND